MSVSEQTTNQSEALLIRSTSIILGVLQPRLCCVKVLNNQLVQLCIARTIWSDAVQSRPFSVLSGKCTTQMVIQSANLYFLLLTKDTGVI